MALDPGWATPGTPGELRHRLTTFLAAHEVGVLALGGEDATWAMPVTYRSQGLAVTCLVPRWAEIDIRLVANADALLVVPAVPGNAGHWLACRGTAQLCPSGTWPSLHPTLPTLIQPTLYDVVELTLSRLDLVDERSGWGRRENLDV